MKPLCVAATSEKPICAWLRTIVVAAITILVFACCFWEQGHADPPVLNTVQQRMLRMLTSDSEKTRLKALANLQGSPEQLHAHLDVLITAAETLLNHERESNSPDDESAAEPGDDPLPPMPRESLIQTLQLLGTHRSPRAREVLIRSLDADNDFVAMVAADVIGKHEIVEAVDILRLLVRRDAFDRHYGFRFTVVRALARMRDPEAVLFLKRLGKQLEGQLAQEIYKRLADVDLRDFDGNQEQLIEFREELPEVQQVAFEEPADSTSSPSSTIVLDPSVKGSRTNLRPKLEKNQYYGIDLDASRMLFIIDRSGSMRQPTRYGTRLSEAKRELVQAIEGLPSSAQFSILFFDTKVHAWREELMVASDENKQKAIQFVRSIIHGGRTNTYGAIQKCLDFDDQLEAAFLLTDGEPTAGNKTKPLEILKDFELANRWRHLRVHTIGIGVSGKTKNFLQELARVSGAQSRHVD